MAGVRGAWQVRQMAVPPAAAAEDVIGAGGGMGAEETAAVTGEGSTTVADDEGAIDVAVNPPSFSTKQGGNGPIDQHASLGDSRLRTKCLFCQN